MVNITKLEKSLRIELTKSEPSVIVLKAEHLQQTYYFTQKLSTSQVDIPYPSDAFKEGVVKGYSFPLVKDFINRDVLWDWVHTNIYQPFEGFSNGDVPPPGDWVIGKAKAQYLANKAKHKRLKKKKSRGGPAYPDLNVP